MIQQYTADEQSSPAERGKRLKRLRNLANLSRKDIEEKFHIKLNTLKGWEVGRHGGLTEKGAIKILEAFKNEGVIASLDWLMYDIGKGPELVQKFETLEAEKTEHESTLDRKQIEKQIIREVMFFRQHNENSIDLVVQDDGMEPCYKIGDYVAGTKHFGDEIQFILERDCIVQTADGQMLLRHLKKGTLPDTYTLMCLNLQTSITTPILYNVELVSAAPVIWIRRQE